MSRGVSTTLPTELPVRVSLAARRDAGGGMTARSLLKWRSLPYSDPPDDPNDRDDSQHDRQQHKDARYGHVVTRPKKGAVYAVHIRSADAGPASRHCNGSQGWEAYAPADRLSRAGGHV